MKQSDPNHQFIALAAHLFLACFVAGIVALFVGTQLSATGQATSWAIGASAAGFIGLLLTWNLQRTLYLIDFTLWRLVHALPVDTWPRRRASALTGMVAKLQLLTEQERPYHQYRTQQLQQAEESAAQAVRNRLARDLHDSIKQQLFSIQISTAAAQARWDSDADGAQRALADVRHSTQAAMVEMDALLHQLAPNPLEKVGLVHALQEQCEALAYRTDADVQVQIGSLPDEDRIPPGTETAIFRVAQESLSNIARHARAKQITLQVNQEEDPSALLLTLTDDGQGFEQAKATQGMGLSNMRERTTALQGELIIKSEVGQGTTILASFPLLETAVVKEKQPIRPNHQLNRFSLTALLGGFAAMVALFYPVTRLLPARYLADWPAGTAVFGWMGVIAALLVYVGCGHVAVRQMNVGRWKQRIGWGAAAGAIAGCVSYIGLIGSGLAIVGAQRILQHGAVPTASETEFMWLLINDVAGVVWWTYLGFWAICGLSMILGGVGGFLVPNNPDAISNESTKGLLSEPLFIAYLSSLFALIMATALYSLLSEQTVIAAVDHLDYEPGSFLFGSLWMTDAVAETAWPVLFPPAIASLFPILSAMVFHLLMMGSLWLALRYNARDIHWPYRRQTIILAYLATFLGGITMLMLAMISEVQQPVLVGGSTIVLILSILFARTAVQMESQFQQESNLPSSLEQWVFTLPIPTLILVYVAAVADWFGLGFLLLLVTAVSIIFIPTRDVKGKESTPILPYLLSTAIPALLAFVLPVLVLLPNAVGMIHLIVQFIAPLSQYPGNDVELEPSIPDFTVAEQVQSLFQLQMNILLITLLVTAMLMGLIILVVKIVEDRRRVA